MPPSTDLIAKLLLMRFMAIDLGDKRTGLASGDDVTNIATPGEVLEIPRNRGTDLIEAIIAVIAAHEPDALVIGLPLNMDSSEGDRARIARAFAKDLAARCELPIHFQDERLTSCAADSQMARTGLTHKQKKQIRDALAAAEILRDFLES